jgi:hypothetical protein
MRNKPTATVVIDSNKIHSLDAQLQKAEGVGVQQKKVVDKIYGGMGEMETIVPAIQNVVMLGTQTNPISDEVMDARNANEDLTLDHMEILGFSNTSVKLIKEV